MQCVALINKALDKDLFRLYYQDIAALKASTTGSHFEIFLRMTDDENKIMPPSSFLPAAERYGLATKIDRWVIRNAIAWLSSDNERIKCLHRASINLSGYSIDDEDFLDFLIDEIGNCGFSPSKICLEITETTAIANVSGAAKSIQRLKDLGCFIAIDDFGTGFSSFAYLKHLPIDVLKIDGIFVKDILTDATNLALVNSINEIGHVMGKQTVAEFVETPEILEKLKEIGVDYVQGYAVGRPMPIEDAPIVTKIQSVG
jgi:EAL domain-containing protein (putative c-di-GMP-specific phosphodiesterase class I)